MLFFINIEEPFFLTIMSTREVYVRLVTKETLLPPRPHSSGSVVIGKERAVPSAEAGKGIRTPC